MDIAYDEVMRAISEETSDETKEMKLQIEKMAKRKLDLKSLGSDIPTDTFHLDPNISRCLETLEKSRSPFEKLVSVKEFLGSIKKSLENSIEESRSPFDPCPSGSYCVLPDDLIAATVYAIIKLNAATLCSNLRYIQMFGRHLPSMNEMAYCLVTIEVAIEYIKHFEVNKSTPEKSFQKNSPEKCTPSLMKSSQQKNKTSRGDDPRFRRELGKLNRLVETVAQPPVSPSTQNSSSHGSSSPPDDLG